jgi:hypothetical protein
MAESDWEDVPLDKEDTEEDGDGEWEDVPLTPDYAGAPAIPFGSVKGLKAVGRGIIAPYDPLSAPVVEAYEMITKGQPGVTQFEEERQKALQAEMEQGTSVPYTAGQIVRTAGLTAVGGLGGGLIKSGLVKTIPALGRMAGAVGEIPGAIAKFGERALGVPASVTSTIGKLAAIPVESAARITPFAAAQGTQAALEHPEDRLGAGLSAAGTQYKWGIPIDVALRSTMLPIKAVQAAYRKYHPTLSELEVNASFNNNVLGGLKQDVIENRKLNPDAFTTELRERTEPLLKTEGITGKEIDVNYKQSLSSTGTAIENIYKKASDLPEGRFTKNDLITALKNTQEQLTGRANKRLIGLTKTEIDNELGIVGLRKSFPQEKSVTTIPPEQISYENMSEQTIKSIQEKSPEERALILKYLRLKKPGIIAAPVLDEDIAKNLLEYLDEYNILRNGDTSLHNAWQATRNMEIGAALMGKQVIKGNPLVARCFSQNLREVIGNKAQNVIDNNAEIFGHINIGDLNKEYTFMSAAVEHTDPVRWDLLNAGSKAQYDPMRSIPARQLAYLNVPRAAGAAAMERWVAPLLEERPYIAETVGPINKVRGILNDYNAQQHISIMSKMWPTLGSLLERGYRAGGLAGLNSTDFYLQHVNKDYNAWRNTEENE